MSLFGDIQRQLERGLTRAGFHLVGHFRSKLNRSQPYLRRATPSGVRFTGLDPSRPGEYPKKLSGQLIKSVAFKVDKPGLTMQAGSAIPWAAWLQTGTSRMRPRPWLTLSWQSEQTALARIVLG